MRKTRLVLPVLAIVSVLALALLAGCGSSGNSSTEVATLAPPKSPLFLEATIRPNGTMKTNVEELAQTVAGVDNLGEKIVSELESSAQSSGEPFDYEKEVEPWLGETAGISFREVEGNSVTGFSIAIPTSDTEATKEFVEKHGGSKGEPPEKASFEGVEYDIDPKGGTAVGVVGDFLVIAQDERSFKEAVEASNGESLAESEAFGNATANIPSGSIANVYVNLGTLIEQGGGENDEEATQIFKSTGIDPSKATALASLIPGSEQIEIDVSSNAATESTPSGDASKLLGSLPGGSFAAFASPEFGKQLQEAIDKIDASGIPGELPPHKLKSTLSESGIDLDKIAGSLADVAVFAEGQDKGSLGGAVVLTTNGSSEAASAVASLGLLLRASNTPGVTAISGQASGFSVRSKELGPKPLVVATKGERIAIGYGLPATMKGLSTESSTTLSEDPAYKEAVAALGSQPISGFVDGPAALRLAESLVPSSEEGFQDARPYLAKAGYVAIGSSVKDDVATAKLILGLKK